MSDRSSPIALFVFARPDHTRHTLDALARNRGAEASELIIFADGSRGEQDDAAVAEVRRLIRAVSGFRSVTVVERPHNFGLARNIIEGVSEVLAEHETVIVVEDDLVTSPGFLAYMNGALDYFADDPRVASIHGYVYPVTEPLPPAFFLRGADCWGWATWRRAWSLFEPDGASLLHRLEAAGLTYPFDLDGAYGYTDMLRNQIAGRVNSWAVRWHAAVFLADKLTLYPGKSLVRNIGFDGSGTHRDSGDRFDVALFDGGVDFAAIPVREDAAARRSIIRFFKAGRSRPGFVRRVIRSISKRLPRLGSRG